MAQPGGSVRDDNVIEACNTHDMVMAAKDFDAMQKFCTTLSFDRLSAKKDDAVSAEKRELIKEIRGQVKKTVADLQEKFFEQDRETILSRMQSKVQQASE